MPKFEITAPDGRRFEITAPEGSTPDDAIAWAQSNLGGQRQRADARTAADVLPGGRAQNTLLQGLTFGLSDEVAGAGAGAGRFLRSLTRDGRGLSQAAQDAADAYNRVTGRERASVAQFKEDNPVLGPTLEIGGGFLAAAPALAGQGAVNLARGVEPLTTAGAALQSAKAGATGGALAGFGSAEGGLENRLEGAATGGALGGALGGSVPLVANAVGRFGGRIADSLGLRNPQTGGDRQLLRAFERDAAGGGPSLEDVASRVQANTGANARPEFLPDVAGENVKRLAAMATQTPGTARQIAQTAIEQRVAGQPDRISDDVARLVSPNQDFYRTVDSLTAMRARAARPLYDEAFSANQAIDSPLLRRIEQTPAGQEAFRRARSMMQNDMQRLGATDAELTALAREAGLEGGQAVPRGGVAPGLKLEFWDYVKRALDDQIGAAQRAGENNQVRVLSGLKSSLVRELDSLDVTARTGPNSVRPDGGAYARARAAYAGPSQSLEAMDAGRAIFKPDSEITAKMIADMPQGDKDFFLMGVARAIKERVDNTADGRNAVSAFFRNPAMRDKLRAAFPSEDAFNRFAGLMERETNMFRGQAVYGPRAGSPTARNMADAEDAMIDPPGGVLGSLMRGQFGTAATQGVEGLLRRAQGMNSATADYLGPILFNSRQEQNAAQLARLLAARQEGQRQLGQNQALARALLGGAGVATGVQTD